MIGKFVVTAKAQRLVRQLLRAIHARDLDAARAALDAGADPNLVGAYNATPLRTASSIFDDEPARNALTALLLDRGADPNDRGPYRFDNRPIFHATYCGYDAVARMLVERGGFPRDEADAPARDSDGATLLSLACASGLPWLIERALDEGCRADDIDRHGSTALHYATVVHGVTPHPSKNTAWCIETLLDHGAPIEHVRPGDWGTALHWAVAQGDAAAVRTLVARGADLESMTDVSQRTPLLHGATSGSPEALRAVIELGAFARATDAAGMTALHIAARHMMHPSRAEWRVLGLLLEAGVDANAKTHDGKTALELAVEAAPRKGKRVLPLAPAQSAELALLAARTEASVASRLKLPA